MEKDFYKGKDFSASKLYKQAIKAYFNVLILCRAFKTDIGLIYDVLLNYIYCIKTYYKVWYGFVQAKLVSWQ